MSKVSVIATKSDNQFCSSLSCIDSDQIEKITNIPMITFPAEITKIFVIDREKFLCLRDDLLRKGINLFERKPGIPFIESVLTDS